MKKNTLHISIMAALCVFCTAGTDAFGAGSVRALGGAGTYNGTVAATNANTSSTAARATRAGSLRVSPSTTRSVSTATRTTPSGATENTQRLSIGKYLGPATSVSTSGGASSGGSSTPGATAAEIAEINNNITNIINNADRIEDKVDAIDTAKQDKLTAGEYVIIENDEVSVDLTSLEQHLQDNLDLPNKVKIQYDSVNDKLQWSEDGGTTWSDLMGISDLAGDYVSAAQLENKIDQLAKYATKSDVQEALDEMTDDINTALDTKANASDVYTKSDIDTKLENVATDEVVAGKQPKSTADYTLGTQAGGWNPLTAEQQNALNSGIDATKVGQIATNKADVASMYGALQVMDDKIALKANQNYVETELGTINNAISDIETIRSNATAGKTASDALGTGFDSTNTVASTIATLADKVDDLPTDANLTEANEKITALEGKVGNETAGLVKDVADLQDDIDSLADVAFSGDYADLANKPTIPVVPTVVSAFENDAGYLTEHQSLAGLATTAAMDEALEGKADAADLTTLAGRVSANETGVATNADKITELQGVVTENATDLGTKITNKQDKLTFDSTPTAESANPVTSGGVAAALETKANANTVATYLNAKADKDEVDAALAAKANTSDLVQADWNEEDSTKLSFIQNKPSIPEGSVVDATLSDTSTNAVQNKVVTGALGEKIPLGNKPSSGEYVLGFINGVQAYIPIVDGEGNTDGPAIAAATGEVIE